MTAIGGLSETVFKYRNLTSITTLTGASLATPQNFVRIVGKQTVIVKDISTGFMWGISVDGGYNALSGGYITSFDNSGLFYYVDDDSAFNISSAYMSELDQTLAQGQVKVNTLPSDSGGRTYILTFSRFTGVAPTIVQTAGVVPAGNVTVTVKCVQGLYLNGM